MLKKLIVEIPLKDFEDTFRNRQDTMARVVKVLMDNCGDIIARQDFGMVSGYKMIRGDFEDAD